MNNISKATDFAAELRNKNGQTGGVDELKVDPHFEEDPKAAMLLEYAISNGKNILIVGPTGSGKSSLACNVLARLKRKAEIFSCHGETSSEGLIGKPWVVVDPATNEGITKVSYGAALRAYSSGKVLILEEVDMAMAGILASIQRIMEVQSDFYICDIGEEEIIPKNKQFSVIATANTIGTGEDDFMYAGTNALNLSFVNRFSVRYIMGYLSKERESKVLVNKTGIDKAVADKMVLVANDVRDAGDPKRIAAGTVPGGISLVSVISTRDLIEWSHMVVNLSLDIKEAANYAFLNCMPESDQESVKKFISNQIV